MKKLGLVFLFTLAPFAYADVFHCEGKIVKTMVAHGCPDPARLAFKTTGTGGSNGSWICSASATADSLILAAALANKDVRVTLHLTSENTGCDDISHYTHPYYIQLLTEGNGS